MSISRGSIHTLQCCLAGKRLKLCDIIVIYIFWTLKAEEYNDTLLQLSTITIYNLQLSELYRQYIYNAQWYLCLPVYCVLCTVYCVLCIVYCVLRIVYCVLRIVYCLLCTVYCVLCTVYCVLCTVYCVLCIVYCVLCIVYCVLRIAYCVLCIVYLMLFASLTI